jgi:6-phosphogluconolactonase (cycloisomerase 2 family)
MAAMLRSGSKILPLTRRQMLGAMAATATAAPSSGVVYAYAGCYTTAQRSARGDGIHVYRIDPQSGAWTHIQRLGNLVNPSFLAMSRDGRHMYSVHGDESYVTAFAVDNATGQLSAINHASSGGRNGVHLAIDPSGRFVVAANYATGNVGVLPIRADGGVDDARHVVALPGQPGPHRVEQTASRPHAIVFDPGGRSLIVPDKGLDRIFIFRFDQKDGQLTPTVQGAVVTRSLSGPRHAAFHPKLPIAWAVNEIGSTITTFFWDAERGSLRPLQYLPSTPADYTGENTTSEIAVSENGGFVYCSNRGHDSIAIYAADPRTGLLTSVGWMPTGGRTPRFIGFDPSFGTMYAANEQSDTIVAFRADAATGKLTPTGMEVQNLSPVCIVFAAKTQH